MLRILLVDDNALVRGAISRALRSLGCFVVVLATFAEAVEALETRPFEVVIADYRLSPAVGENGLALLERPRDRQPRCHRALCSGDPPSDVDHAVHAGLVGTVLHKPVTIDELKSLIAVARGSG